MHMWDKFVYGLYANQVTVKVYWPLVLKQFFSDLFWRFLLRKGPLMAASVAGITSSYLAAGMPKVFLPSASSSLAVIAGTTFVSVLPTFSSQTFVIREPIVSGLNVSLPQVLTTSLATQTVFGVFCPCFLTCLRVFTTQNNSNSLKGNFGWVFKAILHNKKCSRMLYGCLTVQIVVGGLLPYFTLKQFEDFVANVVSPRWYFVWNLKSIFFLVNISLHLDKYIWIIDFMK